MATSADNISNFYNARNESDRLTRGIGPLEAHRTQELLSRYLPPAPAVVCDVGGATGFYARWLCERGYTVHLIDPVSAHVDTARESCPQLASARVGDARHLSWSDNSVDAVLLMGPLYHLLERVDRVRALSESRRILRVNGILFGVVIPRWASTLIGMQRGWIFDDAYAAMVREEIATGRHVRPATWPQLFMDGFFHSSNNLHSELKEAGFNLRFCAAIEGPAWMSQEFESSWQNHEKRDRILELARLAEQDPEVIAISPHVAFVAEPQE